MGDGVWQRGCGSVEQHESGKGGKAYHLDGAHLDYLGAHEGGNKEGDANPELPGRHLHDAEVLAVAEHERGGSQEAHNHGAESGEDTLHQRGVHVLHEHAADEYHQDKRRQHQGECGDGRAKDTHCRVEPRVLQGSEPAVGGRVDADGARRHLRDGNHVGKLGRREPVVVDHRLGLDERQHAVATAKAEEANLEERDKEAQEYHRYSVGLMIRP